MRIASSVQSQAVFRACQLLGGPEQLAARIGVSRLLIKAILKGSLPTSHDLFLKVVDILAAANGYDAYEAPRPPQDARASRALNRYKRVT